MHCTHIYSVHLYPAIKKNEIIPFAAIWMILEIIMPSEVRKRKTNTIRYHLYTKSKIWHKWAHLQNRNRSTDTEDKIMATKGEIGEGWIRRLDLIYTLLLLLLLLLGHFSRVQLCVTPQTGAHQAPRSLGFSGQEHWSGLPFPSPMQESEKWKVKMKSLSCVRLLLTPWTVAHQAPPLMGFSRQEYWSGVPLPKPLK